MSSKKANPTEETPSRRKPDPKLTAGQRILERDRGHTNLSEADKVIRGLLGEPGA